MKSKKNEMPLPLHIQTREPGQLGATIISSATIIRGSGNIQVFGDNREITAHLIVNAVNCHKKLLKVKKHAEFLQNAVESWFTKVGEKYPSFPSTIIFSFEGLKTALYEINQDINNIEEEAV